ncbi:Clp protease N-terminal domain-containing protein [Allokutzneria sp. NRRL B-24872]|uniref:Clp protease N-terminal domain-containing protein n=1 Tax=Allokutzneria sp. NRRL B-24872 TaxID=1137961 RepID=UPI000A36110B|nr:Clp protease N-terminal domain-containing protein [Allokutzneria sp. NRRL B-24872]
MTKYVMAANLSVLARDETSRRGHPEVDVEHLFLALLLSGGGAGNTLRGLGITVERARAAVEAVHAERIASLGIEAPPIPTSPIREPGSREIYFSERAVEVVQARDDIGILRALVDEPSGLVDAILRQLGLTADEVHQAAEAVPPQPKLPRTAVHSGFIPAPVKTVWALLADPARRPEWDTAVVHAEPVTDSRWEMTLTTGRRFELRELSNVVHTLE